MDEGEDVPLPLRELRDRRPHRGAPVGAEHRGLGLVAALGRLNRLSDLDRDGVVRAACRRVERGDVGPLDVLERGAQPVDVGAELGRELRLGRTDPVSREEGVAGLFDPAALATDRARGPVLLAQLVDERAGDAGPGVLLEAGALHGVEAVDRLQQRDEASRGEIVDVTVGRQLPQLAGGDVAHHRRIASTSRSRERESRRCFQLRQSASACAGVSRWDVLVAAVLMAVADIEGESFRRE